MKFKRLYPIISSLSNIHNYSTDRIGRMLCNGKNSFSNGMVFIIQIPQGDFRDISDDQLEAQRQTPNA